MPAIRNSAFRNQALSFALVAALAAAGCSKPAVEAENESVAEVAKKVDDSAQIRLSPGRWEATMKLESMEMPGMDDQARAAIENQAGMAQTFASCLTPEQAAAPSADFFRKAAEGCTYDHFTMTGGKVDAQMSCLPGKGPARMTMQGTYAPEQYDMAIQTDGEMQPGMAMKMAMSVSARRTGPCTGKES
jgi:hypothetical protein